MILAEISAYDPPVLIASALACLGFLLWICNSAMEFWRGIKDKPTGGEVIAEVEKRFQPRGHYAEVSALKDLASHTTTRHSQLFASIERLERENRRELQAAVNGIQADRTRTMEKMNGEFAFIRESLVAIRTELDINKERR